MRIPHKPEIPEQSFWQRLPKGSLVRILLLLVLLAGIVYLQTHSESFFGGVERAISPERMEQSPRVRMAPPQATPDSPRAADGPPARGPAPIPGDAP